MSEVLRREGLWVSRREAIFRLFGRVVCSLWFSASFFSLVHSVIAVIGMDESLSSDIKIIIIIGL